MNVHKKCQIGKVRNQLCGETLKNLIMVDGR